MSQLAYQCLGGALEVGANCHVISDGNTTLMLDAGMHPKRRDEGATPEWDALAFPQPKAIVLSHAHADHIGAMPIAAARYRKARILTAHVNEVLGRRMLRNALRIHERHADDAGSEGDLPFTADDLDELHRRMRGLDLGVPHTPLGRPPRGDSAGPHITLLPAGHILGACGVLVTWNGHRTYFTGDLSIQPQGIIDGATLPSEPVDTLLLEGTLGLDRELDTLDRTSEAERFGEACAEVLHRGGSVLAPCFALGRTQEMLHTVASLMDAGTLPRVPVYIGGLGAAVSEIYDATRHLFPRRDQTFMCGDHGATALPRDLLEADDPFTVPSLFLVTSGMLMRHTPSFRLAQRLVADPKHALFFVGYVDYEADGYPLYRASQGDVVSWAGSTEPVTVACTTDRFRFTAHARRRDLLGVVERLSPERVILVHGAPGALESLRESIEEAHPNIDVQLAWPRRVVPLQGDASPH